MFLNFKIAFLQLSTQLTMFELPFNFGVLRLNAMRAPKIFFINGVDYLGNESAILAGKFY